MWLTSVLDGKYGLTKQQAREVFLSHQNDARALCFAWHLSDDRWSDLTLLRRAAEMGNAYACSTLCERHELYGEENEEEVFRFAQLAASQYERDGFRWLGVCFELGCKHDMNLAKQNYLIAAELGDIYAASSYSSCLDESDPAGWLWFGRAALRGFPDSFLDYFSNRVEEFFSGSGYATNVFLIGRALKGNIDMEKKRIFGQDEGFDSRIGPANRAVLFYDLQVKSARLAVDTWTLVATRLHIIKDMRIYIGKMIWEARCEANYMIDENHSALRDQKRFRK